MLSCLQLNEIKNLSSILKDFLTGEPGVCLPASLDVVYYDHLVICVNQYGENSEREFPSELNIVTMPCGKSLIFNCSSEEFLYLDLLHTCCFGDLGQHIPASWPGCAPRPRKSLSNRKSMSYLFPASALVSWWHQRAEVVTSWCLWSLAGGAGDIDAPKLNEGWELDSNSCSCRPRGFCRTDSSH